MFNLPTLNQKQTKHWIFLYWHFSTLILLIISLRFYQVQALPDSFIGFIFCFLHAIGHIGTLVFITSVPLLILNLCRMNRYWIVFAFVLTSCLSANILLADTYVFQQYRFHINAMILELFIAGGDEVISFPIAMWMNVLVLLVVIFCFKLFVAKKLPVMSQLLSSSLV